MLAVSLEKVSKRYRIFPSRSERLKDLFGRGKAGRDFWALKDVDLQVEPGTALGVVGRNGAGKSTLLKIISGVLQPTSGVARVNGRLVALLQLGAGFNDEFTGRENVFLNGLILGIGRKEMMRRFDEIEAFADIGDFMYQPVKTYSSGMRARLGFAVAMSVEPDVMLVDETLSVGDAVFKAKGIQKMRELRDSGTTILFVSHSISQVQNFCTEAVLLHKGGLVFRGETSETIERYQAMISEASARRNARLGETSERWTPQEEDSFRAPHFESSPQNPTLRHGTGEARIQAVELLDADGDPVEELAPGSDLTVRVRVRYARAVEDAVAGIVLRSEDGIDVFSTDTALEKAPLGPRTAGEGVVVDFSFGVPLRHGRYSVAATVSRSADKRAFLDWIGAAGAFDVTRPEDGAAYAGLVRLPTRTEVFEPNAVPPAKK